MNYIALIVAPSFGRLLHRAWNLLVIPKIKDLLCIFCIIYLQMHILYITEVWNCTFCGLFWTLTCLTWTLIVLRVHWTVNFCLSHIVWWYSFWTIFGILCLSFAVYPCTQHVWHDALVTLKLNYIFASHVNVCFVVHVLWKFWNLMFIFCCCLSCSLACLT